MREASDERHAGDGQNATDLNDTTGEYDAAEEYRAPDPSEARAVARARHSAPRTSPLGPGTSGHTTTGAAYRGQEVAEKSGQPAPAEPGFGSGYGLGYVDEERGDYDGYGPAQRTRQ